MSSADTPITQSKRRSASRLRSLLLIIGFMIALVLTIALTPSQDSVSLSFTELWQALLLRGDAT